MNNLQNMFVRLTNAGGKYQQDRMIKDKLKSLTRATQYSYQGASVSLFNSDKVVPALINPNKLSEDYDEKIISINYDYNFQTGDVFKWINPSDGNQNNYWLIYLQDLTELAYFKARIRQCKYFIQFNDQNNEQCEVCASIVGPKETNIRSIIKSQFSMDLPSQTITLLIPNNTATQHYFQRYAKFYLNTRQSQTSYISDTCWRVENIDALSLQNILIIYAREYYHSQNDTAVTDKNNIQDDTLQNINKIGIVGDTYVIKPMLSYAFKVVGAQDGIWKIRADTDDIVRYITLNTDINNPYEATVSWNALYGNEKFELIYETEDNVFSETITISSMY